MSKNVTDLTYKKLLANIKQHIGRAQQQAIKTVNQELLVLYWHIGESILSRQKEQGWGTKIIDRLAADIQKAFPELKGFSARNLKYMSAFAKAFPMHPIVQPSVAQLDAKHSKSNNKKNKTSIIPAQISTASIVQPPVAQLPFLQIGWAHHVLLLSSKMNPTQRNWYITQTIENGWSRDVLRHQLETDLYHRQAKRKKVNNFAATLPPAQSELAQQLLKDPYIFDFITLSERANEKNIEDQLCEHVTKFLLEMGQGFAFIGRQYRFKVGKTEYPVDLLFYNIKLRCYVVVELKTRDFEPEDTGKLNFYLNVVNKQLRSTHENPTIGLLLCKGKNEIVADYALTGIQQPIGVADYKLTKAIPKNLKSTLPSIKELERELKDLNLS